MRIQNGTGKTARWALLLAVLAEGTSGLVPARAQTRPVPAPVAVDRPAVPQAVSGDVSVFTQEGYARLLFTFASATGVAARANGSVLVIAFDRAVRLDAGAIQRALPAYASAVRLDPDGKTLRIALARRLTINTMEAGEKVFVDLLPESWTGLPPPLPKAVVDELVRRAAEAERLLKARAAERAGEPPELGLRVGTAATFARLVFSPPRSTPVSLERKGDRVTLTFLTTARFDPQRWREALPETVRRIEVVPDTRRLVLAMTVDKDADIRGFLEGDDYVVDVSAPQTGAPRQAPAVALPAPVPAAAPEAPKPVPAMPDVPKPAPAMPEALATPPAAPPPAPAMTADVSDALSPKVIPIAGGIRVALPYPAATKLAAFQRDNRLYLAVDERRPLDTRPLTEERSAIVRSAATIDTTGGLVFKLDLDRPRIAALGVEAGRWILTIADRVAAAPPPLTIGRSNGPRGPLLSVDLPGVGTVHRFEDAATRENLLIVTAAAPARQVARDQAFVELSSLATLHGLALVPRADDLAVNVRGETVVISRRSGLTMTAPFSAPPAGQLAMTRPAAEAIDWDSEQTGSLPARLGAAIEAAAMADAEQRTPARLALARLQVAHALYPEARGVLTTLFADDEAARRLPQARLLNAMALIGMDHDKPALRELGDLAIAHTGEADLLRALLAAEDGRMREARAMFQSGEIAVPRLPPELRRRLMAAMANAAIEMRDFAEAQRLLRELQIAGEGEGEPRYGLIAARIAEGLGRGAEARRLLDMLAKRELDPAVAAARLALIAMRRDGGQATADETIAELERLTTAWRGDLVEAKALRMLGGAYLARHDYRDAFRVLDAMQISHAARRETRDLLVEAQRAFETLFLAGDADTLSPVTALSLYYDYRRLTPPGRKGDEMIRRLSDRMVAVDLLDQAAALLQHQVANRLVGAARAQVAARLAVIYLMNRNPAAAFEALKQTRLAELPADLKRQRLLLEARALSELKRYDLALDLVGADAAPEALRLKGDILWNARRWREAAETIERYVGLQAPGDGALGEETRRDLLKAAIGYSLADEALALERLRGAYQARMAETPDARAFQVVTAPDAKSTGEYTMVVQRVAGTATIEAFLNDYKARYPDAVPNRPTPPS